MAHKVFICHSSKDKLIADAACAALEAHRISCWIAPRDILAGDEYGAAIIEALDETQIVLLIFSHSANDSPQVRREIERAVSKEKILVPFRIEDVMPSRAMEFHLMNTHWLDALSPPIEQRLTDLTTTVSRILQKQAPVEPLWTPARASVPHATPTHPEIKAEVSRRLDEARRPVDRGAIWDFLHETPDTKPTLPSIFLTVGLTIVVAILYRTAVVEATGFSGTSRLVTEPMAFGPACGGLLFLSSQRSFVRAALSGALFALLLFAMRAVGGEPGSRVLTDSFSVLLWALAVCLFGAAWLKKITVPKLVGATLMSYLFCTLINGFTGDGIAYFLAFPFILYGIASAGLFAALFFGAATIYSRSQTQA